MNGESMYETPRLYPATIDLTCPDHGHVQRVTIVDLAAQKQWTDFFQDRHQLSASCTRDLVTLVPDP